MIKENLSQIPLSIPSKNIGLDSIEPFTEKNMRKFNDVVDESKRKEFIDLQKRKKESRRYNKLNKNFKNRIHNINYYLLFLFLIQLDIVGLKLFNNLSLGKSNYSYIIFKVKGIGERNVFYNNTGLFLNSSYPDEIYINENKQDIVNYSYYFNQTYNYVKFVWNNEIDNPSRMFLGCSDITEVDLSHFNTSIAKDMSFIFEDCISITSLNLNNIDTSKTTLMTNTFKNCKSLTSLNLSSFDTSKVRSFQDLFSGCISLSSLDISNFDTISGTTTYSYMFNGCINLEYINFKKFSRGGSWNENIFRGVPKNIVICAINDVDIIKNKLSSSGVSCYVIDCRDDWKSVQKKINTKDNNCIDSCDPSTEYKNEYNLKCYQDCPSHILINNNTSSEIGECKCQLEQIS